MARKRRRTKRRRRRGGTHTWEHQQKKDHKDLEDEVKKARSGLRRVAAPTVQPRLRHMGRVVGGRRRRRRTRRRRRRR